MKSIFVSKVSNVRAWTTAFTALGERGAAESCLMLVDGEPGLGKTKCAAWWATQHGAMSIRAKEGWTQTWFLRDLHQELTGKEPTEQRRDGLFRAVIKALGTYQARAQREGRQAALVIDEADHAAISGRVVLDAIRDITDTMEIPTILVGMSLLSKRLGRHPQVQSRISQQVTFQPLSLDDVQAIITSVCEFEVKPDLVKLAHRACGGFTRELKEAIAAIERTGQRQPGKAVGVEEMRGQVLLRDRASGTPIVVG